MRDGDSESTLGRLGTSMVLGAGAAGLSLIDPVVGIAASAGVPALQAAAGKAIDRVALWRSRRMTRVLAKAAEFAGLDPDELIDRAEVDADLQQLLMRTLQAAADAPTREKLVLYAISLAAGSVSGSTPEIQWETLFVRALEDLDKAHLELLHLLTMTGTALGLASGPEFDEVPRSLNLAQLEIVAGHLPNRTSLLAVLERHGLINRFTATGGMSFSVGPGMVNVEITDFGRDVHERLVAVGEYLTKAKE